jgi:hypothetical protein
MQILCALRDGPTEGLMQIVMSQAMPHCHPDNGQHQVPESRYIDSPHVVTN